MLTVNIKCCARYERMKRKGVPTLAEEKGLHLTHPQGGSGHLTVRLGDRTSQLPMHGGGKELGRGLVAKIKKDLGLD